MPDRKNHKRERLPHLLETLPVGVFHTSPKGKIIKANATLIHMLGYLSFSDLENINSKDLYVKSEDWENHLKMLETSETSSSNIKIRCKDGHTLWCRDYQKAVLDANGKIAFYEGILVDMSTEKKTENKLKKALKQLAQLNTERKKMIETLESLTLKDHLTGLYNRRGFTTIATKYLHQAKRNKMSMHLIYLDVDNLKIINDTYGHNKGDFILVALAEVLQKTFRQSDIMARIGGDEFAIFPIDNHIEGVNATMARLKKNIDDYNATTESQPLLSVSTGISFYNPAEPCSVNELLIKADNLMYEEKRRKQKT